MLTRIRHRYFITTTESRLYVVSCNVRPDPCFQISNRASTPLSVNILVGIHTHQLLYSMALCLLSLQSCSSNRQCCHTLDTNTLFAPLCSPALFQRATSLRLRMQFPLADLASFLLKQTPATPSEVKDRSVDEILKCFFDSKWSIDLPAEGEEALELCDQSSTGLTDSSPRSSLM
jgi:hypothetical protein